MGYDFLRKVTSADWPRLFEIQRQGWAMLMSVMGRVADLVVHTSEQVDASNARPRQDAEHLVEPVKTAAKSSEPRSRQDGPLWSSRSQLPPRLAARAASRARRARSGRPRASPKYRARRQNRFLPAMQSTLSWPLEESRRIPGWVYTDPSIYAREQERIFGGRSWNYVGLTTEIPRPGDFLQTYVGEKPVVVVRDHESQIHVFVNRCTHRGSQFCLEPYGHAEAFICPYHQWTFDLDGKLKGIPFRRGISGQGRNVRVLRSLAPRVGAAQGRRASRRDFRELCERRRAARRLSWSDHPVVFRSRMRRPAAAGHWDDAAPH